MSNAKEEVDIEKMYGEQCTLNKEDFIKKYHININGLSKAEANKRITNLGLNEITRCKTKEMV